MDGRDPEAAIERSDGWIVGTAESIQAADATQAATMAALTQRGGMGTLGVANEENEARKWIVTQNRGGAKREVSRFVSLRPADPP